MTTTTDIMIAVGPGVIVVKLTVIRHVTYTPYHNNKQIIAGPLSFLSTTSRPSCNPVANATDHIDLPVTALV